MQMNCGAFLARYTIIESDMGNRAVDNHSLNNQDKILSLELTTECNLKCSHCFATAGLRQRQSLPRETVESILIEGYLNGYRYLHFTGGEPLLWDGTYRTLDDAYSMGYEKALINTNGTLISNDTINRLSTHENLEISISMQGQQAVNDQVRGKDSFHQALNGVKTAVAAGVKTTIFLTVSKSILKKLPQIVNELYKTAPDIASVTLIQLTRVNDDLIDLSSELLTPEDYLQMLGGVSMLNIYNHKTQILYSPLANVVSNACNIPWIPVSFPKERKGNIFVMANKDVTLSHYNRNSFGKYAKGMIETVLQSEEYKESFQKNKEICPSCKYHETCLEHGMEHPAEPYLDMNSTEPYCRRVLDMATR